MSDSDLNALDRQVLDTLGREFPVSQSPYCDIAAAIGSREIDVLNSAMKLRETGALGPVSAQFARLVSESDATGDEGVALAELLTFDIPWGEHPFAEIAAQLSMRGIDNDEAWVLEHISAWLADGTIVSLAAEPV